jgi:hypothetical protein
MPVRRDGRDVAIPVFTDLRRVASQEATKRRLAELIQAICSNQQRKSRKSMSTQKGVPVRAKTTALADGKTTDDTI